MAYKNFPTPADIAPQEYVAPPLDEKWEALVMEEIADVLHQKRLDLQSKRAVRFAPSARRDTSEAAQQWKHYASHIADLVRERGWHVMTIIGGARPTLSISLPHEERPVPQDRPINPYESDSYQKD